jgi:lipoprotein signal peptidase
MNIQQKKNKKKEKKNIKKLLIKNSIIFLFISILVIIDQTLKDIFQNKNLILNKIIKFEYSLNKGSSFSIFSSINNYNFIIIILSIIIILILINYILKKRIIFLNKKELNYLKNKIKNNEINIKEYNKIRTLNNIFYVFSISGIIGNLIDRILFHGVRDFIYVKNFSIFNLADIYLNLSLIIAIIILIKINKIFKNKKIQN